MLANLFKMSRFLVLFFIFLSTSVRATPAFDIKITGIQGEMRSNVQNKMNMLIENHLLSTQNNEELTQSIAEALYPFGYFKPIIRIIDRQVHHLTLTIDPGPSLFISKLELTLIGEGKQDPFILKTARTLQQQQGSAFISANYEKAKTELSAAAEKAGYLKATFTTAQVLIDKKANAGTIHLVFDTGPQYYFGQVEFDPTYLDPRFLHRFVPFHSGQPFSTEQLLAFNSDLSSSGYFKSIAVKPQLNNADQTVPINVHLEPSARAKYSLGLGFGTDTGIRGRAGYHVVPVNRWGHKFNVVALGSLKENSLQTQYVIPGANPVNDQYDLMGSASTLNYNSGYSNSVLVSLAERHNVATYQRILSLNTLYERFNYDNQPHAETVSVFPKLALSFFKRSSPLFSPTGFNMNLTTFAASKAVLSKVSFAQGVVNAKVAYKIDPIRTRIYLHGIAGINLIDDINHMPLSLALLLGGADNLKAYSYNSIGPGRNLTYGGIELQKETVRNWYVLGFIDSGDVYSPDLKHWQNDVGLGLMWVSPVGPIKIGLAEPLTSRFGFDSHDKPRLVISMGPDL